jgi:hypothetical protein
MADVDNIIQGTEIQLFLRESGTSDAYQELVCFLSLPLALTSPVTKKKSSCGTHVATQDVEAEISGSAICNIAPGATEVSYDQMVAWQIAKTALDYKYVNKAGTINGVAYAEGDIINFTGSCKVGSSTFKADASTDESIEFDFNVSMSSVTKN